MLKSQQSLGRSQHPPTQWDVWGRQMKHCQKYTFKKFQKMPRYIYGTNEGKMGFAFWISLYTGMHYFWMSVPYPDHGKMEPSN
jgi:hypothetical protein